MLAKTYAKKIEGGNTYRIILLLLHLALWLAVAAAEVLYLIDKLTFVPVGSIEVVMLSLLVLFFLLFWAWTRLLRTAYVYLVTNAGVALYSGKVYQRFAPAALSVEVAGNEKSDLFWFSDVMMLTPTKPRVFVKARSMALFTKCEVPAPQPVIVEVPVPVEVKTYVRVGEPEIRIIIREAEAREAVLAAMRASLDAAATAPVVEPAPMAVAAPAVEPAPVVEVAPVVTAPTSDAAAEPVVGDGDEGDDDESEIREVTVNGRTFQMIIRYSRSFTARVIQADDTLKNYYSEIKNELLSYDLVKSRISWKHDAFNRGRLQLAKLVVRGKNLCVYLALDPAAYEVEKYHQVDQGDKNAYAKVPMMIRVKSDLGLRKAKFLISEMMANYELEKLGAETVDYASAYAYKDTKSLIADGLIKELQGGEIEQ